MNTLTFGEALFSSDNKATLTWKSQQTNALYMLELMFHHFGLTQTFQEHFSKKNSLWQKSELKVWIHIHQVFGNTCHWWKLRLDQSSQAICLYKQRLLWDGKLDFSVIKLQELCCNKRRGREKVKEVP